MKLSSKIQFELNNKIIQVGDEYLDSSGPGLYLHEIVDKVLSYRHKCSCGNNSNCDSTDDERDYLHEMIKKLMKYGELTYHPETTRLIQGLCWKEGL